MVTQSRFRKTHCLLFILTLALGVAASELPVVPPESAGMSSAKLSKVDGIVEDLVRQKKLAGATVAVARHGKLVYLKTFGKMDLDGDKPMRKDTIFRIYSMSKAITTAAALIPFISSVIEESFSR